MRIARGFTALLMSAVLSGCVGGAGPAPRLSWPANSLALVGATIYVSPEAEPIQDGVVLISDRRIVSVGPRASIDIPSTFESIDCSGLTITAGFWNSHVHLFKKEWANASTIPVPQLGQQLRDMFTRYGFTSVFDTGSMWENTRTIRDRVESGEVWGPRIRSTGEPLVAPNAVPPARFLEELGFMVFPAPEITDAEQAASASRQLLESGVDGIKVHLQPPPGLSPRFPLTAIPAAVREAHRVGKPVFVHPDTGADVQAAARAGVDVVAHTTPRSGPWDEATLASMKEAQVALIPTLTLWDLFGRRSPEDRLLETAVGQLRAWHASGGAVLFGTDAGAVADDPTDEYVFMSEAGMSFQQILASLTTEPASRLGDPQHEGRVAEGFQADLVVFQGDPSESIGVLADVQYTLRGGVIVYQAAE